MRGDAGGEVKSGEYSRRSEPCPCRRRPGELMGRMPLPLPAISPSKSGRMRKSMRRRPLSYSLARDSVCPSESRFFALAAACCKSPLYAGGDEDICLGNIDTAAAPPPVPRSGDRSGDW